MICDKNYSICPICTDAFNYEGSIICNICRSRGWRDPTEIAKLYNALEEAIQALETVPRSLGYNITHIKKLKKVLEKSK